MLIFPDPPATLTEGTVRLRLADERDIPEVLIAHQDDPGLAHRLGLARPPSGAELGRRTERAQDERLAGTAIWFTVLDGGDDECRGQLDVIDVDPDQRRATLRLWIAPGDRGRGLGRAALGLAGRWLLTEGGLARLELPVDPRELALRRAALAAGFRSEGVRRAHRLGPDGRRADVESFSLVAADLGS